MHTQLFKFETNVTKQHIFPHIFMYLLAHRGVFYMEFFVFMQLITSKKEKYTYAVYISQADTQNFIFFNIE